MAGFKYGVKPIWQTHPTSIDVLRECVALRMSAAEAAAKIANAFNVSDLTRNTVIGKARRLGIKFDSNSKSNTSTKHGQGPARASRAKPQKLHKTVFHVRPEPAALPAGPIAIPESRRVSILELTFHSCRWPLGDPRDDDFCFCGADRVNPYDESNAYCDAHAAQAYRPAPSRQISPEHRLALLAGKIKAQLAGGV